jgi:hypothetical protein
VTEYKITRDGVDQQCDCCQSVVATGLFEKPMWMQSEAGKRRTVSDAILREDQFQYCKVCASTMISHTHSYAEQYANCAFILRCMAACTNIILQAIREKK